MPEKIRGPRLTLRTCLTPPGAATPAFPWPFENARPTSVGVAIADSLHNRLHELLPGGLQRNQKRSRDEVPANGLTSSTLHKLPRKLSTTPP